MVRRHNEEPPAVIPVKPGLGDAYDEASGRFQILNKVCYNEGLNRRDSEYLLEERKLDITTQREMSLRDKTVADDFLWTSSVQQQGGLEGENQGLEGSQDYLLGGNTSGRKQRFTEIPGGGK